MPDVVEREAIKALRGVGGPHEWWIFTGARVGHLRVPITGAEDEESGPQRPRTR